MKLVSKILVILLSMSIMLLSGCNSVDKSNTSVTNKSVETDLDKVETKPKTSVASQDLNSADKGIDLKTPKTASTNSQKENYSIVQKEYTYDKNGKSVMLSYPQIDSLNNINELIKNKALNPINEYVQDNENFTITVKDEVSLNKGNLLSIKYSGLFSSKTTAHPTDLFYTTNIDLKSGRELLLKDFVNVNESFLNDLKNYGTVATKSDSKELIEEQKRILKNLRLEDLKKPGTYTYLTDDSLGISVEIPHAAGDHMEIEIPYKSIPQDMNNAALKGIM